MLRIMNLNVYHEIEYVVQLMWHYEACIASFTEGAAVTTWFSKALYVVKISHSRFLRFFRQKCQALGSTGLFKPPAPPAMQRTRARPCSVGALRGWRKALNCGGGFTYTAFSSKSKAFLRAYK